MSTLLALYGGDRRQLVCAHLLQAAGYQVTLRATGDGLLSTNTPLSDCAAAIFPMPCGNGERLHAPLWSGTLTFPSLMGELPQTCLLFAGMPNAAFQSAAGERTICDYSAYEPLNIAGAVATVEGAIATAMACLPCTLWQTNIAILGFGRIGKLLAHRLHSLGANVTVFARKETARAWAAAYGYRTGSTAEFAQLADHRVIFNTVPAQLLDQHAVALLAPQTLYLELASSPGIDIEAAQTSGVRVELALGLPGKQSPESAGRALFNALQTLLEREGILP